MEVTLELGKSRGWDRFEVHDTKSLDGLEGIVNRNMDIKRDSG